MNKYKIATWFSIGFVFSTTMGCGVDEYESLVRSRMQGMATSQREATVEWSTYHSSGGITVAWPGESAPAVQQQGDATLEEVTIDVGGVSYRAQFMHAPNVDAPRLATKTESDLSGQGYILTAQEKGEENGFAFTQYKLELRETQTQILLRVWQVTPQDACILTATGKDLSDSTDVARFLSSVTQS